MTDSQQDRRSWPRLDRITAKKIIEGFRDLPAPRLSSLASADHEKSSYPPVGGRKVGTASLERLRVDILAVIDDIGCSSLRIGDKEQCRRADIQIARVLHGLPMSARSGQDPETWNFLACILLPDVVRWRFPASGAERFLAGPRNALQRLWTRARILHDPSQEDPWHLLAEMPEDALVQVFERPAIWNDHRFSRSAAKCLVNIRHSGQYRLNFQELVRMVLRMLRQEMPFISFTSMTDPELEASLDTITQRAAWQLANKA